MHGMREESGDCAQGRWLPEAQCETRRGHATEIAGSWSCHRSLSHCGVSAEVLRHLAAVHQPPPAPRPGAMMHHQHFSRGFPHHRRAQLTTTDPSQPGPRLNAQSHDCCEDSHAREQHARRHSAHGRRRESRRRRAVVHRRRAQSGARVLYELPQAALRARLATARTGCRVRGRQSRGDNRQYVTTTPRAWYSALPRTCD